MLITENEINVENRDYSYKYHACTGDFARLHMQPKSCDPLPNQEIITSSQYCHAATLLPSALSETPQSHKGIIIATPVLYPVLQGPIIQNV